MKTATGKLETYYIDRKTGTAHKVNVGLWKHHVHVRSLLQSFQYVNPDLHQCYIN
jgi:hypothetical protein